MIRSYLNYCTRGGKDVSEADEDIVGSCIGELVTKIVDLSKTGSRKNWKYTRAMM